MYLISNEVDDILEDPTLKNHVKNKCFNIKEIIKSILGRNRLEQPPLYVPRPVNQVQQYSQTYQRRNRRDRHDSSQPSQTDHEEVDVRPSQPPPTQTQTPRKGRGRGRRGASRMS